MSTSEAALGPRPGLSNVADIIVAPNAAFDRLRLVPTWGWAFLVATLLAVAGTVLVIPAMSHAMDVAMPAQFAANPAIAKLPPDQQQRQIAMMLGATKMFVKFSWLFAPIAILVVGVLQALVMMIANAASHGDGSFRKFFALSITVTIVGYGLNAVVLGIIALVRGAGTYESTSAIQASVPGLAMIVPGAHGFLAGFLGAMNVFYLWATALLALGMVRVGRIVPATAWSTAIAMLLLAGVLGGWGALRNG